MKAVILSGGAGTRLRSISGELPKPMMPLLGTPLLAHTAALLRDNGFTEMCVTLHHKPEVIRDYLGDGSALGISIRYRMEDKPLGTAGAVKNCRDFLGDAPFLVMSGDCACDFDLNSLMARHGGGVTIALSAKPDPLAYGLVVTDHTGAVAGFLEKPAWEQVVTDRVSTGIYVLNPEVLDHVPEDTPYDFARDLFPHLLKMGIPMTGVPMEGYWCDIGTPKAYYQCNLDALEGRFRLPGDPGMTKRILPCKSRARLMGVMSQALVEFGADFSDGLTLEDENGKVRLAPLAEEDALSIQGDPAAVRRLEALARKLQRELGE